MFLRSGHHPPSVLSRLPIFSNDLFGRTRGFLNERPVTPRDRISLSGSGSTKIPISKTQTENRSVKSMLGLYPRDFVRSAGWRNCSCRLPCRRDLCLPAKLLHRGSHPCRTKTAAHSFSWEAASGWQARPHDRICFAGRFRWCFGCRTVAAAQRNIKRGGCCTRKKACATALFCVGLYTLSPYFRQRLCFV